jgi:hypothetical protein
MGLIIDTEADLIRIISAATKAALQPALERIMTALTDLQAANAAEETALEGLETEEKTFLADIAAALAAAGTDPTALAAVTTNINARVTRLNAVAAEEVAADPADTPATTTAAPSA